MARSNMFLLIAGCVMIAVAASAVEALTEYRTFRLYEHDKDSDGTFAFGPSNSIESFGKGYIYNNTATKTSNRDSENYGSVSGMYYYSSPDECQEVCTITFRDIGAEGGIFANAELFLRGTWTLKNGEDNNNQELAIVGGSYGLAGAYGSVTYSRHGKGDAWLAEGKFYF